MARSRGKAPSQRQLRVAFLIRHELALLLNDGSAHDPILRSASITVSEVRLSPDIKNATAYVLPLAGQDREARSEERRVGEACRAGWVPGDEQQRHRTA